MSNRIIQKTLQVVLIVTLFGCTTSALADAEGFSSPSQAQIAEAASNPALIADLLQGASPEQAALVVRAVIAAVIAQGDAIENPSEQIESIVFIATQSIPAESQPAFVAALASAVATTPVISRSPWALSAVQAGANRGGAAEMNLGAVFAASYSQTVEAQPPSQERVPIDTVIAPPYAGQQI